MCLLVLVVQYNDWVIKQIDARSKHHWWWAPIGSRSFITYEGEEWHNFLISNCVQMSISTMVFYFNFLFSNVLFSLQLIVCWYVMLVDFYVPIQFYSFYFRFCFTNRMCFCSYFPQRRNEFHVSLTKEFSRIFLLLLVRLRYLVLHLRLKSWVSSIAGMVTRVHRDVRVRCMQNSLKIHFDT